MCRLSHQTINTWYLKLIAPTHAPPVSQRGLGSRPGIEVVRKSRGCEQRCRDRCFGTSCGCDWGESAQHTICHNTNRQSTYKLPLPAIRLRVWIFMYLLYTCATAHNHPVSMPSFAVCPVTISSLRECTRFSRPLGSRIILYN